MIKVISFDMDGTLIDNEFNRYIWYQAIPELYSRQYGIKFQKAKQYVSDEYDRIGMNALEWYDIKFWFSHFRLEADWKEALQKNAHRVNLYPEVKPALAKLSTYYKLVVTSLVSREFLEVEVQVVGNYFQRLFSVTSDFSQVSKNAEVYHSICRLLNIAPNEMAHIGDDHVSDFLIPRERGIRSFYLDRQRQAEGSDVVHSLEEVIHKLLGERQHL